MLKTLQKGKHDMPNKLPKILYIDDEEWNLTAFRFMFRDEFEVLTADDTDTAEAILNEHLDIDVVISDQRMPEETGVQFFERMRPRLSTTERIILTGYSDIDAVIGAINRAGVYFYLRKPWQEEEVRLVLRNAIDSVRMHRRLIRQEETLRLIEDNVNDVIARTDLEGNYLYISPSIQHVSGYAPEEVVGHAISEFMHPEDVQKRMDTQFETRLTKEAQTIVYRFRHKHGHYVWIEASVQAVWKDDKIITDVITVSRDITERKAAEQKIEFLAYHDALTELPNRLLVRDRVRQAIAGAEREKSKVALLFLDLDNFKTVNDSLGHTTGDVLLKAVAKRLKECVRGSDTLSRQGGDEFLIVMPGLESPEAAAPVLDKIRDHIQHPFEIDGNELMTSVSIGVALYPDNGRDFDTLLKKADTAMYRAKEHGRNTYRFFDAQMNVNAVEHLNFRNGLRRALECDEFVLHYQPQIELASGTLIGAEALLRWQHPDLGLVPPGRFIPVAEDSGLIVTIGEWVLREACRQAASWPKCSGAAVGVAVNLSAVQFKRGNLEKAVLDALEASGLDPARLELELTESILIRDTEEVLATVRQLKALGVKLSIDDFGTGYSSLSYLKRFDVDKLKIDQSFVRDMATDPEDEVIVRTIIQMAQSLDLRTIAEGVETEQMLSHLKLFHCDEVQGFHIARPMPAGDFVRFIVGG
ncbi:MAG: Cyclic di-GMP phosphodiesterase Gmr [Betaproteobacteria bacterium ADurb.Bin341]|nr:MAG: Cyclic di-GMP phosphodiesterase Gmr [Betaproteobacteria bacterium ADurb.Bin341]